MKADLAKINIKNIEIEIIPYDGSPNPRNPYDWLTPEERHKKIVELYAQLCIKIMRMKRKK